MSVMRSLHANALKLCFLVVMVLPLNQVDQRGKKLGMTAAASAEDEFRVIGRLLNTSMKYIRPVKNTSEPVRVTFDITFHSVIEMDEKHQILSSNIWVRQNWTNQLVQWDPNDYGGLKHIMVDSTEVWLPDVTLYNNVFEEFDGRMDHIQTRVNIHHDGLSQWAAPFVFKTSCHIDVSNFPFDNQHCRLKFGSWQYDGSELDLQNAKNFSSKTSTSVEHGEWEVRNVTIRRNSVVYACCPNVTYPDVTFTIHLKRRSLFYIVNLILPNFLIALLGFFSFFIPVECGERISFVITVLLSMTVFLLLVAENIPPTSEAVPIIGVFYTLSIVEIALALVATGITLKIYYSYLYGHGLSPGIKRFLLHKLGPLLGFSKNLPKHGKKTSKSGDKIALLRILQEIKDILKRENGNTYSLETEQRKTNSEDDKNAVKLRASHSFKLNGSSVVPDLPTASTSDVELCRLSRQVSISEVNTMGDYLEDEVKETQEQAAAVESRLASAIVDRAFMLLFLLVFVISTIAVFVQPSVREHEHVQ